MFRAIRNRQQAVGERRVGNLGSQDRNGPSKTKGWAREIQMSRLTGNGIRGNRAARNSVLVRVREGRTVFLAPNSRGRAGVQQNAAGERKLRATHFERNAKNQRQPAETVRATLAFDFTIHAEYRSENENCNSPEMRY